MLFNSVDFALFFLIVLGLYWALPHRWQNVMLLAASYFFYGWWDWRFLSLILFTTGINYTAGLMIGPGDERLTETDAGRRKLWLWVAVVGSLAPLAVFKYYGFFADSLTDLLEALHIHVSRPTLSLILPIGISFYTFQAMSYTIDVYRRHIQPTRRPLEFALFVSFFPQLVAGPIERASNLLPQILGRRVFSTPQFYEGLRLIFWGLFKKVYVADNLARVVDPIFAEGHTPTGMEAICGVVAFAFQIYCDFSGYSCIARGTAACLGIKLMRNFDLPYIARHPRELWRRWHISLSTWLRDYLYIPLGGNRHGRWRTYGNVMITMLLGGLWHGAAWHFVVWGAYHGALLVIHRAISPPPRPARVGLASGAAVVLKVAAMFLLTCIGWLLFRSQSMAQALDMARAALTLRGGGDLALLKPLLLYAGPIVLAEAVLRLLAARGIESAARVPACARCVAYAVLFYLLAFHGAAAQSFIYFQF